jgi:hypothetical protein
VQATFELTLLCQKCIGLFNSLRLEVVSADFDPRFNGKKPLWFERLYKV